jgi:hypothetical protein
MYKSKKPGRSRYASSSGKDDSNTHLSIDIAAHDRVRSLPLVSQERVQLLQQSFGFLAYEAIGGDH